MYRSAMALPNGSGVDESSRWQQIIKGNSKSTTTCWLAGSGETSRSKPEIIRTHGCIRCGRRPIQENIERRDWGMNRVELWRWVQAAWHGRHSTASTGFEHHGPETDQQRTKSRKNHRTWDDIPARSLAVVCEGVRIRPPPKVTESLM